MSIEILMPALSPTMEEGTLAKWLVKVGDTVKSGQILAEIETDKATMEFEAVDEGVIGQLFVEEGTAGIKVNSAIALCLMRVKIWPQPKARRKPQPMLPPPRHQPWRQLPQRQFLPQLIIAQIGPKERQ